ncbi:MAG: type II toxin-antitoxin system VapB family antitoxin [Candidatus Promineifilaceae bacterium]|nr:type II toxin-antitoxin system VapB family antitoxin [Candidatus Promineifilaceae bacterium]
MRTTIRVDDELLSEAKQVAAKTNRTLTAVIEDALRQHLAQQRELVEREPVQLETVDGNGPLPGVDLDDSAALLDLMERGDASV